MSAELERAAAACIFPSFPGYEAPDWILRRIEGGLGGICLFSYNVRQAGGQVLHSLTGEGPDEMQDLTPQLAELNATLRAAGDGLLIGIDEEGGDVTRLELARGSSHPGAWALGAVDDVALTREVASAIGGELAAVGVNLNFAPVADVNVNPANSVIGIRSFGAETDVVARHVAAFVAGLQEQGVAACAKHFPGHGSTEQDSHLELPTVTGDHRDELLPFLAAIEAGTQAVMTAHVRVPALDDAPATLSRAAITGLLREELGYDGLVLSDALEMKAISRTVGIARGAVLALAAGVDAVLLGHDVGVEALSAVQSALVDAVAAGELPEERLREAADRVARTAAWAATRPAAAKAVPDASRMVARRALRAEGELSLDGPPLVVELLPAANIAAGEAEHSLGAVLAERLPGTRSVVVREGEAPAVVARQLLIVLRDAHRHEWMREAADTLLGRAPNAVVVETGVPVWRPDGARGYVATLGGSRVGYEALAELLAGSRNGAGA